MRRIERDPSGATKSSAPCARAPPREHVKADPSMSEKMKRSSAVDAAGCSESSRAPSPPSPPSSSGTSRVVAAAAEDEPSVRSPPTAAADFSRL